MCDAFPSDVMFCAGVPTVSRCLLCLDHSTSVLLVSNYRLETTAAPFHRTQRLLTVLPPPPAPSPSSCAGQDVSAGLEITVMPSVPSVPCSNARASLERHKGGNEPAWGPRSLFCIATGTVANRVVAQRPNERRIPKWVLGWGHPPSR